MYGIVNILNIVYIGTHIYVYTHTKSIYKISFFLRIYRAVLLTYGIDP